MGFKNYNGEDIIIPSHFHEILDTTLDGTSSSEPAFASETISGFVRKEDIARLNNLLIDTDLILKKLKNGVFIKQNYISTLQSGSEFNSAIKTLNTNTTSIVFTKTKIPDDKISSATVVSTSDSNAKSYAYTDGDIIYISPEYDDIPIYTNEDCSEMFYGINKLQDIKGLDILDISNTINFSEMFASCYDLTSLDLSNWDISNVTNTSKMFNNCTTLTSLNLSNWDTSKITNMNSMFAFCSNLSNIIDIPTWTVNNLIDARSVFYYCSSLKMLKLQNWNMSKVTTVRYMFAGCTNLDTLDVTNWDVSKVEDFTGMLMDCKNLDNIISSRYLMPISAKSMNQMFYNCNKISGGICIANNTTTVFDMFRNCSTDINSSFIIDFKEDSLENALAAFETKSENSNIDISKTEINRFYVGYSNSYSVQAILYNTGLLYFECFPGSTVEMDNYTFTSDIKNKIREVVFCENITATNISSMFQGCTKLKTVNKLPGAKTIGLNSRIDYSNLFNGCINLTSIKNIEIPETICLTSGMFQGCINLTGEINIKSLPTTMMPLPLQYQIFGTVSDSYQRLIINYTPQNKSYIKTFITDNPLSYNIVLGSEIK